MAVLGAQCNTCPSVAWIQQNTVSGNAPPVLPAAPTDSDPGKFPQIVYDVFDNGVGLYSNNLGMGWDRFFLANDVSGTTNAVTHGIYFTDTSGLQYDISGDPGSSNRPVGPSVVEGDVVIEPHANGLLLEWYDTIKWRSFFFKSCAADPSIALTNGILAPADPEAPTQGEVDAWVAANGPFGTNTQVTYTSPGGRYYTWIIDPTGLLVPHVSPNSSPSRKEGQDTLANNTTTISFDDGLYDNKMVTLTSGNTFVISTTRPGDYNLNIKSDDGSPRTVSWPGTVLGSPPTVFTDVNGSVVRLYYDGTNFHS